MSNFIPNIIVKIDPKNLPLNIQEFKQHRYWNNDKVTVDKFRENCNLAVQAAKGKYLRDLGSKLTNPNTSKKSYWKFINKHKMPKIPPSLINNEFFVNCKKKAVAFNNLFATQCKTFVNKSILPV